MSYFTTPSHFPLPRSLNTDCLGFPFAPANVRAVWEKGYWVLGRDPAVYRKDECGALIKFDAYGEATDLGWHIDHKIPVSQDGGDELENLQPLHWRNNLGKSDNYPGWTCTVRAKV